MFSNLGLKLKVFFFMAVILATLSAVNFMLFRTFISRIDMQQGPKNTAKLVTEVVRNTMFSLIDNSFQIAKDLNFTRASRNAPLKLDEIKSPEKFAVIDQKGGYIAGNFTIMNNYSGIPAVERALKSGIASDGIIKVEESRYVIGVVPVMKEIRGDGNTLFAVISARPLSSAFREEMFPVPVRVFLGERFVRETMSDKWSSMERSCGQNKMEEAMAALLKSPGNKTINRWTYLNSIDLPSDVFGGEKVTIISMTSFLPGWEEYSKVFWSAVLYTILAILILLFFTFIVTHEIGRVFRRLGADISRLKVGEKLVLKKYSHGADIAVSALNTLISKYQRQDERDGRASGMDVSPIGSERITASDRERKITAEIKASIPDPFGTEDVEDKTPQKPIKALEPETPPKQAARSQDERQYQSAPPPPMNDDEDDEKTQIAANSISVAPIHEENVEKTPPKDLFDELWDDYCKIKEKNGELATDKEKKLFIGKLRTNRASIMARYNCADVSFSIEEKDGKPVIKAKPIR